MQTYISQLSAHSNMHNLKDARTYSRACHTQNMRIAKPNVNHKHRNSSLPCGFDIYDSDKRDRQKDRGETIQMHLPLSPQTLPHLKRNEPRHLCFCVCIY